MKKTLIALAVLGAAAGVAHAQSNVTIYGIADIGFIKQEDVKLRMGEKVNNRLGFRGVEDLGGGLKATFELEQRFDLFNGNERGGANSDAWDGASNAGLAGQWGAVRFGRVNELSTETFRTLDPFNQYGVGGMFENPYRSARVSSTTRYDSPKMGGFSFGASWTLENQAVSSTTAAGVVNSGDAATDNHGYGLSVKYANGPIIAMANYNRAVNSNDSYNWNVGGSYAFGPAKISLGYEKASIDGAGITDRNFGNAIAAGSDWKNILVGASYKIGSGTINASFNRLKTDLVAGTDLTDKKYAIGYTHDLSKRTAVYLDASQVKADSARGGDDTINGVQLGLTHKF